jgi:hypothetical protein
MMVSIRVAIALTGMVAFGAAGQTLQAQAKLKYQFKPGETMQYVMAVTQKNTQKGKDDKGKDVELTAIQKQTVEMSWQVQSVDDKGAAKIRMKYDRVKFSMDQGTASKEVSSDSRDDPADEPAKSMTALARALAKLESTFTMTPRGEIQDLRISPAALKEMRAVPGAEKLAGGWTNELLQATLKDNTLALPAEPTTKGTTWKSKVQGMSPYGKVTGELEYVCEGPAMHEGTKVEKFLLKPRLKIDLDANLPATVTIKKHDGEGAAYFDATAGRLVEVTSTTRIDAEAMVKGVLFTQQTEGTNSLKLVKVSK